MELNSKQFKPNLYLILDKENVESKVKVNWKRNTLTKKRLSSPKVTKAISLLAEYRGMGIGENFAEAFSIVRSKQ